MRRLWILEIESGKQTLVDTAGQGDIETYVWSPDGRWLAYETAHASRLPAIAVYSLDDRRTQILGDGLTDDSAPAFGADGNYLFFLSNRDYRIRFSDFEFNFLYDGATRIYAAALDPAAPALFPPRSDEEETDEGEDDQASDGEDSDEESDEPAPDPVRIVPEGFTARTVSLPGVEPGDYAQLTATEGALLYLYSPDGERTDLMRYDLSEREPKTVLEDVALFALSGDGKKVLYRSGPTWALADATPVSRTATARSTSRA